MVRLYLIHAALNVRPADGGLLANQFDAHWSSECLAVDAE
jgi:hypothetical protein